jgi:hypothetical protein
MDERDCQPMVLLSQTIYLFSKASPRILSRRPIRLQFSSILGLCLAFSADKRHENSTCRTGDPGDDRRHWPTYSYATQPAPNPDEGMAKRVCGHLPYDRRRAIAVR